MPDPEAMRQAVETYLEAFSAGDVERVVSLYAEEGTLEDPVGNRPVKGLAAIRELYSFAIRSAAVQLQRTGPVRIAADYAAFPFTVQFRDANSSSGSVQKIDVIDTMRFDAQNKVVEMRAYFTPSAHTQAGPGKEPDPATAGEKQASHAGMAAAVKAYAAAWNAGDVEGLLRLYTPESRIEDPVGTPAHVGTDAIRALFSRGIGMGARVEITGPVRTVASHAVFPLHVFVEMDGKKQRIDAIDIFRFNGDHRIVTHRGVFGADNQHIA